MGGWERDSCVGGGGGIIAKWRGRYASPSTPKTGFFMCSLPTFKYWQRTHKFLNTSEAAALYSNFGLRQFPNLKKATSPHQVKNSDQTIAKKLMDKWKNIAASKIPVSPF